MNFMNHEIENSSKQYNDKKSNNLALRILSPVIPLKVIQNLKLQSDLTSRGEIKIKLKNHSKKVDDQKIKNSPELKLKEELKKFRSEIEKNFNKSDTNKIYKFPRKSRNIKSGKSEKTELGLLKQNPEEYISCSTHSFNKIDIWRSEIRINNNSKENDYFVLNHPEPKICFENKSNLYKRVKSKCQKLINESTKNINKREDQIVFPRNSHILLKNKLINKRIMIKLDKKKREYSKENRNFLEVSKNISTMKAKLTKHYHENMRSSSKKENYFARDYSSSRLKICVSSKNIVLKKQERSENLDNSKNITIKITDQFSRNSNISNVVTEYMKTGKAINLKNHCQKNQFKVY